MKQFNLSVWFLYYIHIVYLSGNYPVASEGTNDNFSNHLWCWYSPLCWLVLYRPHLLPLNSPGYNSTIVIAISHWYLARESERSVESTLLLISYSWCERHTPGVGFCKTSFHNSKLKPEQASYILKKWTNWQDLPSNIVALNFSSYKLMFPRNFEVDFI